jgi:hypothetical protein
MTQNLPPYPSMTQLLLSDPVLLIGMLLPWRLAMNSATTKPGKSPTRYGRKQQRGRNE